MAEDHLPEVRSDGESEPDLPPAISKTAEKRFRHLVLDDIQGDLDQLSASQKAMLASRARGMGFGWDVIARQLGYASPDSARVSVDQMIANARVIIDEAAKIEAHAAMLMRLDLAIQTFMPRMLSGDVPAFNAILKADEARRELLHMNDSAVDSVVTRNIVLPPSGPGNIRVLRAIVEEGVDPLIALHDEEAYQRMHPEEASGE